jgi:single-strand DNA-binding protein
MGNLNKVMLIGRLGKDPEIRYTQSGNAVANFTLATNEYRSDSQGQRQEKTEWHNIVVWNKLADLAQNYLKQGSQVYLEGRIQTNSWDDAQTGKKKYRTEVIAYIMQFLGNRPADGGGGDYARQPQTQPASQQDSSNSAPRSADASAVSESPNPQNPSPSSQETPPVDSYIEDDIPF